MEVADTVQSGFSGGLILNDQGQVVGQTRAVDDPSRKEAAATAGFADGLNVRALRQLLSTWNIEPTNP